MNVYNKDLMLVISGLLSKTKEVEENYFRDMKVKEEKIIIKKKQLKKLKGNKRCYGYDNELAICLIWGCMCDCKKTYKCYHTKKQNMLGLLFLDQ